MISLNLNARPTVAPERMVVCAPDEDADRREQQEHGADCSSGDQLNASDWLSMVPKLERAAPKDKTNLVFEASTDSRVCEQFRIMQHRLVAARPQGGTVLITSPSANDGKSFNCLNLAWAIAEAGHKTLLLDLDLRQPTLQASLDGICTRSIEHVLAGDATAEATVRSVGDLPFYFIGLNKPVAEPLTLLRGPQLSNLLKWARQNFVWILLDAPPVLPVADVEELLPSVDLVLMVVRERVTRQATLQRAAEMLGERLNSLIFNDVSMSIVAGYGPNYDHGYR